MAFLSAIGVLFALFFMIASHFHAAPTQFTDLQPSRLMASLERDAKEKFLLAQQKGVLPENATLIAQSGSSSWRVYGLSSHEKKSKKEEEQAHIPLFSNGLYALLSSLFSGL